LCRPVIQIGLVALQHTATHTATCCTTYCNTLHHNSCVICLISEGSKWRRPIIQSGLGACCATHCKTLQHTAIHCNTLQHLLLHIRILQSGLVACFATYCKTLQHTHTLYHTTKPCLANEDVLTIRSFHTAQFVSNKTQICAKKFVKDT